MQKYFFILFFSIGILFIGWKTNQNQFLVNIPIVFSKKEFPIIKVNIERKEYPLHLALISKYPFFLNDDYLKNIKNKIPKGEADWKNVKGEKQTSLLFEIPKIQIGNLKLEKPLVASELLDSKNQETLGDFAWPLDKMNLFLDFPRQRIVGIKNEKDLKKLGYDIGKMEKVKCKINKKGIYFKAVTSLGEFNMGLATCCNGNVINKSIFEGKDDYINTEIKIGETNFGQIKLRPFEITQELEVDGMLGSEFLKKHIVYIDACNEYLYIGEEHWNTFAKNSFSKIPVNFTYEGMPVIEIEIMKKKYPIIVDLGCCRELLFLSHVFVSDGLKLIGTEYSIDALGGEKEQNKYILPECRIENYLLKNLFLNKTKKIGVEIGIKVKEVGTIPDKDLGCIGLPLLQRANIYFDFSNSALWLIEQEHELKKIHIQIEEYEKIPFKLEKIGIVLNIKSDLGDLRLLVDTGASVSVVKPEFIKEENLAKDDLENLYTFSKAFIIGNFNYGGQKIYPCPISSKIENIDGVLGMDFLREHAFYIDYQNRFVYFQKNSKN